MKWLFWLLDDEEQAEPAGEPDYVFRTGPWKRAFVTAEPARTFRTGPWARVFRG